MGFSQFMSFSGVIKDTFRCGGLASINVSHDSDITGIF